MGDKIAARAAMRAAGVPIVPGHRRRDHVARGPRRGRRARLPDPAQGGRRRRRQGDAARRGRRTSSRTPSAPPSAEAEAAFGDGALYVEKVLAPARHVEIQVLCDAHGERADARRARVLDPAPPPEARRGDAVAGATPELREAMEAAAERACRAVGYVNAGHARVPARAGRHVLVHRAERPAPGRASGHRARARASTSSASSSQVAAGEPLALTGRAPRRGHAIEIRLNAEDPARDFMPAPGTVSRFRPPLGPGVRVDTFVEDGHGRPAVLRLAARQADRLGRDRPAAIARAERALEELVIEGVPTTRELALAILRSDEFRERRLLDGDARGAAGGGRVSVVVETDAGLITVPDPVLVGIAVRAVGGGRRRPRPPPAHDRHGGGPRAPLPRRPSRRAARRGRRADAGGRRRRAPRCLRARGHASTSRSASSCERGPA